MKKILSRLSLCTLGSIAALWALYAVARFRNQQAGSFLRLFPPHPVMLRQLTDIKYNSYYFAGLSHSHIYLANRVAPLYVLVLDRKLQDTGHLQLSLGRFQGLPWRNLQVSIDSPWYTISDGTIPIMVRGNLQGGPVEAWHCPEYFTLTQALADSGYAFRIQSAVEHRYVLSKSDWLSQKVDISASALTKQVDGLFCEDGILSADPDRKRLFYTYYYRNQFICLDSQLQIVYKGRTIDTNTMAKIEIGEIPSDGSRVFSKPPLLVNVQAAASENYLFIQSNLMAKNEDPSSFDSQSTIDVYATKKGAYQFSFHLYHQDKPISAFRLQNSQLLALFDHYISLYDLEPKYFRQPQLSASGEVAGGSRITSTLTNRFSRRK